MALVQNGFNLIIIVIDGLIAIILWISFALISTCISILSVCVMNYPILSYGIIFLVFNSVCAPPQSTEACLIRDFTEDAVTVINLKSNPCPKRPILCRVGR